MDTSTIYQQTEQHVRELFRLHQSPKLLFHNLHHTEYVVQRAREIADNYDLNDQDKLILHLATWFHDTGYLFSSAQEHEAKSVEIMKQFAREQQVPFDIVSEVQGCIMATKMPR